jgi:hypothetical protein
MNYLVSLNYYLNQKGGYGLLGKGFGLANVGNTCWLNAFTQLIIHSYEFMKKLKLVQKLNINNKDSADKKLLYNIIQFIIQLHDNIKDNNTVDTLNDDVMKLYASNMTKFIGKECEIGALEDSDERLANFMDKIIEILDMNYEQDVIVSNVFLNDDVDTIINTKKNELVQSNQNNNPFDIIFEITKNIYKNSCNTIINPDNRDTTEILGSVHINIVNGWLTISGTSLKAKQNNNLQNLINDKLQGEVEQIKDLICGGNAKNGSIKVTFKDKTIKVFQALGNPDQFKEFRIEIYNNIVYYTQSNKNFDSKFAIPDKGASSGSPDSIWVFLKDCVDHIKNTNLQIESAERTDQGEPYVDATKTKNYNLIKNGNLPSTLFIKIARPNSEFPLIYNLNLNLKHTDYSVSIKLNEDININGINDIPQKYILIGGIINEGLGEGHYTSFWK